ncbi:MAG: shikimate dehydrogenase [Methylotetracoccus sp.]
MSTPLDRYAVFGHPIGHSKSPRIHTLFAEATRQHLIYYAEDVDLPQFDDALARFLGLGGRGLNCTVPLKEAAFRRADELSPRARACGAVNTLVSRPDGSLFGDNTDGAGLVRDLRQNLGLELAGRRLLVLGAGGAARGILAPLLEQAPERLVVANRTIERARQLAEQFGVTACGFPDLEGECFDLVLNATAASLGGDVPPLPRRLLTDDGCCYDLAYGSEPTAFVRWGLAHGARLSIDGIGMLAEQAAEAFHLWRGVRPDTAPVIAELKADRGF